MERGGVPVIDMQDDEGLAERLKKASEEWGCFRLVNHGVPETLMVEIKQVAASLLNLPEEVKVRTVHAEHGKGYTPPHHASPFFESLGIYDVAFPGTIDEFCDRLGATFHQREIIYKYSKALHDVAGLLGRKLMEGYGLVGDLFDGWPCQFKLNKYNYSSESVGLTGAIMHSDPGFLTVLQDDENVNGLEAVDKYSGELVPVDPVPATLVVNVGDVAKAWSNGRFCNVKHRVQCYEPKTRFSIALFVLGPKDKKVEAPTELVDSKHPRLYVPFDFEQYRNLRASTASPTGGALELFSARGAQLEESIFQA